MQSLTDKVKTIKSGYIPAEESDFDRLKKLDKKVKRPAYIIGGIIGVVSALVFGTGLCICLGTIDASIHLGVAISAVGAALAVANYFICRALIKSRKAKFSGQITELADKLLNEENK